MTIKSVEIVNFQKHSKLKIDFVNDINIIHGISDSGKSAIRRAIEWCYFNQSIDGVRKLGTKQTSVCIIDENGIEIEKVRSSSINRYILRDGHGEKIFDAVGKTIPQEIKDAINISPLEIEGEIFYLNSANQLALPFLFDKSPTWRMKLFNKLTGNEVMDSLFVQMNKDILRIGKELKRECELLESRKVEIETKGLEKEKLEAIYEKVRVSFSRLKELNDKHVRLTNLQGVLQSLNSNISEVNASLKGIILPEPNAIEQLTEKIDKLDRLVKLQDAFRATKIVDEARVQINQIKLPDPSFIEDLLAKIDRLEKLQTISSNYTNYKEQASIITEKVFKVANELDNSKKELESLFKELKTCFVCGQEITEETIKSCIKNA